MNESEEKVLVIERWTKNANGEVERSVFVNGQPIDEYLAEQEED